MSQNIYEAKNARVKQALEAKSDYILLINDRDDIVRSWHYALVQVGSDRIPVPVLIEQVFGWESWRNWLDHTREPDIAEVIGYEPVLKLDRHVEIIKSNSIEELIDELSDMMIESMADHPEGLLEYTVEDGRVKITTDSHSDWNGDSYYREFIVTDMGVIAQDDSTHWSSPEPNQNFFWIEDGVGLEEILKQAESMARNAIPDSVVNRQARNEDLIRKMKDLKVGDDLLVERDGGYGPRVTISRVVSIEGDNLTLEIYEDEGYMTWQHLKVGDQFVVRRDDIKISVDTNNYPVGSLADAIQYLFDNGYVELGDIEALRSNEIIRIYASV